MDKVLRMHKRNSRAAAPSATSAAYEDVVAVAAPHAGSLFWLARSSIVICAAASAIPEPVPIMRKFRAALCDVVFKKLRSLDKVRVAFRFDQSGARKHGQSEASASITYVRRSGNPGSGVRGGADVSSPTRAGWPARLLQPAPLVPQRISGVHRQAPQSQ